MASMMIFLVVIVFATVFAAIIDAVPAEPQADSEGRAEQHSPRDKASVLCTQAVQFSHGNPGQEAGPQARVGWDEGHYNETLARLNCTIDYDMLSGVKIHYRNITTSPVPQNTYKIYNYRTTWNYAVAKCESDGAHLAVINSEAESKAIVQMYKEVPYNRHNSYLMVGVLTIPNTRKWITLEGKLFETSDFNQWAKGEPNNYGSKQACGAIARTGKFYDVGCNGQLNNKYSFICEKEADTC